MSNYSTFGAFTTARLGIYAAQKALNVTGHNITNINTLGYTRQRLDQISLRTGGGEKYTSKYNFTIGSGVLCTGVSQLRDPYLDIRFRNEQSSVGAMDAKLGGLEELSKILDEVGKGATEGGVLQEQFNDLIKQIGALSDKVGQDEYDTLVRSSAEALTRMLRGYSEDLETVRKNQDTGFRQDIDSVNGILKNLGVLNDTIQKSQIHGDPALELRDQRNLLLDQLSGFMKITVEYQNVKIGAGAGIEKMVVKTAGTPQYTLVDGNFASKVGLPDTVPKPNRGTTGPGDLYIKPDGTFTGNADEAEQIANANYDLTFGQLTNAMGATWGEKRTSQKDFGVEADRDTELARLLALPNPTQKDGIRYTATYTAESTTKDGVTTYHIVVNERRDSIQAQPNDTVLYGSLQSARELLTEAGEFSAQDVVDHVDSGATTKRGIPYYQKALDSLAQKVASVLNEANTGYLQDQSGNYVNKTTGKPIMYLDAGGVWQNMNKQALLDDPTRKALLDADGVALGGPLFSNDGKGNDTTGITAANIHVSNKWSLGDVRIVNSFTMGTNGKVEANSTDTTNILHLLSIMKSDQSYKASDMVADAAGGTNSVFFKGSFQEMLTNTSAVLANDMKSTTTLLDNYAASATELNTSRDSIAGVDLNDEAANMMMYQKSYAAACRLMTTLDEALDKLINGTGVVGR